MVKKNSAGASKSWFEPRTRGWREGVIQVIPVEILEGSGRTTPFIISVPSSCGTAVRRNRFRRIARAHFMKKWAGEKLWIRLSGRYRLDRKILIGDWQQTFDLAAQKALS